MGGGRVSDKTSIQWTDATWNPIRGCSRVSPGCEHCYAEGVAARFSGPALPFEGLARRTAKGLPQWTGKVRMVAEKLADPLRWKRPRRIFVNSVSDLFHDGLSNEQIAAIFGVMAAAPQHTFQVLTKRPERMREWFRWVEVQPTHLFTIPTSAQLTCAILAQDATGWRWTVPEPRIWPLPNVWLGVSVEDQKRADERIPELLDTPAAVRWVSAEPLLEEINLSGFVRRRVAVTDDHLDAPDGAVVDGMERVGGDWIRRAGIDWVVVGGESGAKARPFDPIWAACLVASGRLSEVPIFVKQMGAKPVGLDLTDGHGGDWDEWPEDLRVREFPAVTP